MPKRHPELKSAEWIQRRYVDELATIPELAAELGCRAATIIGAMHRFGIAARTPQESRRLRGTRRPHLYPQLNDAEWLRQKYETEQLSTEQIAALLGSTAIPVLRALIQAGIPRRKPGGAKGRRLYERIPELHDPRWLREQYLEQGRSAVAIGAELGCTEWTVRSMLSRHEIRRTTPLPRHPEGIAREERVRRRGGYRFRWRPDHPFAMASGWVAEHRLVVEEVLGRYLTRQEVVHHVNGKRDDNRLENLLVFPNNRLHTSFHENPPDWVPRCEHCGHPCPERLAARPPHVPLLWEPPQ